MWSDVLAVTLAALVLSAAPAFAGDDPVREKLDAARDGYKGDLEKVRNSITSWFDKREADARREGNKKLVDQVKAERQAFALRGEVPEPLPAGLKAMPKVARSKLEAAYETAIREYTKLHKDDLAAAVEKELKELAKDDAAKDVEPPTGNRQLWVQPRGYFLKGVGKDWFEKWDDGKQLPNLFHETQRTADFVELRNPLAPVTFRLYKDRAVIKDDRQPGEFKQLYVGGWRAPAK